MRIYPYEAQERNVLGYRFINESARHKGGGQSPLAYFQNNVANLQYHNEVANHVEETMNEFGQLTGR